MLRVFSRTAIIPAWLVVFGLIAMSRSTMTSATVVVLVLAGGIALTLVLVLSKALRPPLAVMTVPDPLQATPPSADFVPNSWPNSGYRNSRQRGTRAR